MCAEYSAFYSDEELEAEMNEVIEYERKEAYDETVEEISEELSIDKASLRDSDAITEIIYSYVDDNLTYEQMINKIYNTIKGETF